MTFADRPERLRTLEALSADARARLLLADDHSMFAEALGVYLERTYQVVGVVRDGRAMVEKAIKLTPDGVIVDVGMPRLNGLDAAQRIKKRNPGIRFVFLTTEDDPNLAAAALELGPIGVVSKRSAALQLLQALHHVLQGRAYVDPQMQPVDWVATKARARQYWTEMTPRQRDVVQMLAEGRSVKEIAGVLDVSHRTVEFHKQHIKNSFNLKNNADLVLFALKRGLISIDA